MDEVTRSHREGRISRLSKLFGSLEVGRYNLIVEVIHG